MQGFQVVEVGAGADDSESSILDDFGIDLNDPGAADLKRLLQAWRRDSHKAVLTAAMAMVEDIAIAHGENIPWHVD